MKSSSSDIWEFFQLKPVRAARVSEISETTAASQVTAEERVNFHIGNPLQDSRLSSAFMRLVLGIDVEREEFSDAAVDATMEYLGWDSHEKPKLEFLIRAIQKSSPYMPRGGYVRKNPHALIHAFVEWLTHQQEALEYDTGEQSGRREIILASGGIQEALRVFLFALSEYMVHTPVRVLLHRCVVAPSLASLPHLQLHMLTDDEKKLRDELRTLCASDASCPTFLILGDVLSEETRRTLRTLSLEYPLFFVEVNNAPNHLSLAREAKLVENVLRFLTPEIFSPFLRNVPLVFITGNADFLNVIENVHFNLKGTPSATEVELLIYLLEHEKTLLAEETDRSLLHVLPATSDGGNSSAAEKTLSSVAQTLERTATSLLDCYSKKLEVALSKIETKVTMRAERFAERYSADLADEFAGSETLDLLTEYIAHLPDWEWLSALERSFLAAFLRHQPHYNAASCLVVSGSSRTALGLLGFHCGIEEVVIPDLSWSYEQCFPVVHAVPLTADLELDVLRMKERIHELIRRDASWKNRGAVVINNPHNATGRIFSEEKVKEIVTFCLENDIYVIDDLSYQNVAPVPELPLIKTVRQLANELARLGIITNEQCQRVITVHSMSKTDCLAGARLAVVEIPERNLKARFEELNKRIQQNSSAIFLCYLFYRNSPEFVQAYWRLRNTLFYERIQALLSAAVQLPAERNPFQISIVPPTGSMYPLLRIGQLPSGLSLDWLASNLARRGIGMLPLATFARTEEGYETGRTTFRLTLGGVDGANILFQKTRYVLIHLNRLIKDEAAQYNRKALPHRRLPSETSRTKELNQRWSALQHNIRQRLEEKKSARILADMLLDEGERFFREFLERYVPERLEVFRVRLLDRALLLEELRSEALKGNGSRLAERLEREFMKDSLSRRQQQFRLRTHDRTVHPTQMFSLRAEIALDELLTTVLALKEPTAAQLDAAAQELLTEYAGLSVPITSREEADEILLDLATLVRGETYAELFSDAEIPTLLSFWSDWDGSNRPSGQGHRLIAAIVMENVRRMARMFQTFRTLQPTLSVDPDLVLELERLAERSNRFTELLNDITFLTHQLEKRYKGIVPFAVSTTPLQRLATALKLRRDPVKVLWQHNDKYEQRMLELRAQRRRMLEYYFRLNKKLRKQLHALIPEIVAARTNEVLLSEVLEYKDILQRTIITPRIQEGMITARDQFAVDTTVYNVFEINTIGGKYGNPGMVLALQISLSSKPEALISLERKIRARGEQTFRESNIAELPTIWSIPLFEDVDAVRNIPSYLDRVWDYATQSRRSTQTAQERFAEILCEVFIAGSDLSQQVGQAAAAWLYLKAKYELQVWLANHGITEEVRIKLGSGEPMQRQGGYYSGVAGKPAFFFTPENEKRFEKALPPATRKSTRHAVTPLLGVFKGGDLRTFQSNLSEKLRYLPVNNFVDLLYHVKESQASHRADLIRAAESIVETRLQKRNRTSQELERLTGGAVDSLYEDFLKEVTENFRLILYGREEDVVGIHAASYFIGRSLPQLRDRPTNRPVAGVASERGQRILEHIAETIPFANHGSLLRAIAHNQAQTMVLGINQLTTGLFRALHRFAERTFPLAERETMIAERLLPHLPVYDILATLRLYHDRSLEFLTWIETAFPAGNSAFVALREDIDALYRYLPLIQQELVRRHGLQVQDFFENGVFNPVLLPTLRPDLAVLLQKNLFNTSYEEMMGSGKDNVSGKWELEVRKLLEAPIRIHSLRKKIWEMIGESVFQRTQSFTELATALHSFSSVRSFEATAGGHRERKLSPVLTEFFRTARAEDEMRNFLVGAVEYLSLFTEGNIEAPVSIVRAMNDIERLAQIEEHALPQRKQDALRFYLLQIARIAGENG